MKVYQFQVLSSLLLLACLTPFVRGQDDEECKTNLKAIIVKQVESFKNCFLDAQKLPKEEREEKATCTLKCAMMKEGILDDDGTLHITNAMKLLDGFTEKFQTRILDMMTDKCQEFLTAIDPKDPTCKSYSPIVKCTTAMLDKICKT